MSIPQLTSTKSLGKRRAPLPSDPLAHPASRSASSSFLSSRYAAGFSHTTELKAHHSCVNALACSSGDGRWLASGGDDKRVLVWDTFGSMEGAEPKKSFRGARSNLFTIAFSSDNTKIFSEDGLIGSYDIRSPEKEQTLLAGTEFNDMAYNPRTPEVFAAADARGRVLLHDARMAFSEDEKFSHEVAVRQHGSFGGTPDALYYAAGSDDFRTYVWSVPPIDVLKARRLNGEDKSLPSPHIAYQLYPSVAPDDTTTPSSLTTPSTIITSHRSIVNTALFHPTLPLIFTSGVEKLKPLDVTTMMDRGLVDFEGESLEARERRKREEDLDTLEYFDKLLENDERRFLGERLWEDRDTSDEEDSEEDDSWGSEDSGDSDVEQDSDSGISESGLEALAVLRAMVAEDFEDEDEDEDGVFGLDED
ncbi:hypothetical protein MNV49_003422 [Pseudohyphozyma bogoriensis]|nr:hypothetical protein MNV49_003422 [Pseudohyphozyma bogoriensis]